MNNTGREPNQLNCIMYVHVLKCLSVFGWLHAWVILFVYGRLTDSLDSSSLMDGLWMEWMMVDFFRLSVSLFPTIITTQPSSHQHQHQHQQRHQERREPLSFINPIHIRNHSITEYPDDRKDEDYFCLDYFAASQCIFADEYEIWTVV